MTPKNKVALLICFGIVVGSFFLHDFVVEFDQFIYYMTRPPRPAPRRAAPDRPATSTNASATPAAPATPAKPPASPPPGFTGVWRGIVALDGRGACTLQFEFRDKKGEPGHFIGYSSMTCLGWTPLIATHESAADNAKNRINPAAAIFSGVEDKGLSCSGPTGSSEPTVSDAPQPHSPLRHLEANNSPPNGRTRSAPAATC